MLARTGATKEDFEVDGEQTARTLKGWKVQPPRIQMAIGCCFTTAISDNRTGNLGHAEFLLTNGRYSVVMMDSRAHGQSGGDNGNLRLAEERDDTRAIVDALYAGESVRHLYALGGFDGRGHCAAIGRCRTVASRRCCRRSLRESCEK